MGELKYPGRDATREFGDTLCKIGVHTLVPPRSQKDIDQHPGVGQQQVLCSHKGNLLPDTIPEILGAPAIIQEAVVLPQTH